MSGKGDTPRPLSIPTSDYDKRWERTFRVVTPSPSPNANGDYVAVVEPTDRAA
jgi:hypothetical protein